ncbi:MAG: hypothetical protein KAR33_01235 [Candidatus Thorarchaeota archaeon]|nr:hypothetical protein [Candidatus Thorarchaeota archaeon]
MKLGKMDRLTLVVDNLLKNSENSMRSCVVTNERGLVVAESSNDGLSSDALAAMISLLSDAATRVNDNLGFGHPNIASVKGIGVTVALHEFMVNNRWFRIGAVLRDGQKRRSWFFRRTNEKKAWENLEQAAVKVRVVLEGK